MESTIRWLVVGVALLLWPLSQSVLSAQEVPDIRVEVETVPEIEAVVPDRSFVETTVRLMDGQGQPLTDVPVFLRVNAPSPARLFNTDFPHVEGTTLLQMEARAQDGIVRFGLVYPVRGVYTFEARVILPNGQVISQVARMRLRENPVEVRNFLVLVAILFAVGLVGGLWIGRGQAASVALTTLALCLFLAAPAQAHGPPGAHEGDDAPRAVEARSGDVRLSVTLDPGHGVVGALGHLTVALQDTSGRPLDGQTTIVAMHGEDGVPTYRLDLPVVAGQAAADLQFFDGAPHELQVVAQTQEGVAVQAVLPVEVYAPAPPLAVKLRVLVLLLGVVVLGMAVGYWAGQRRVRRIRSSWGLMPR